MRTRRLWSAASGIILVGTLVHAGTPTTTSTTTSTLASACVVAPVFSSVLCRLDELVAAVGERTDLGRLKEGIAKSASKARRQCQTAAAATGRTASNQLKKCGKTLGTFRHKLDSNNAHKVIPDTTRSFLRDDLAEPLRNDIKTLRGTL